MDIDKKIRITPGLVISLLVILLPSFAWAVGYDFSGKPGLEVFGATMEKTTAFAGMAMFAWSLILSGRYKILDTWFRGLDKVYIAHRFFGTASVALLLMHPLGNTMAYISTEGSDGLLMHYIAFKDYAITLGRLSLYGLVLLAVWSIFAKVKHETFIRVHRWIGVLFILGATHAFMAGSILSSNAFLWWYMFVLSLLAAATFIHFSLLGDFLHPSYKYKVNAVTQLPGKVIDIELEPLYRIPNFTPGQFFYVAFNDMDPDDFHPYSIASSKDSSNLRFIIKQLGDYTTDLKNLKPGGAARVKGPYGGFTFNDKKHPKQLWIAGGIGITPFLSKAHSLRYSDISTHVTMIHFSKTKHEAIEQHELDMIEENHRSFDYVCMPEKDFGIVSLIDISEQLGSLKDYAIYMCGPPGMMNAYRKQAQELGIEEQLYFEEFTY